MDKLGRLSYGPYILTEQMQNELNEVRMELKKTLAPGYVDDVIIAGKRFYAFTLECGHNSIRDVTYKNLIEFHNKDNHKSKIVKGQYESHIRMIFHILALKGYCTVGFELLLSKMVVPHVILKEDFSQDHWVKIEQLREQSQEFPADEFLQAIDYLVESFESKKYSKKTCLRARRVLTALFLFLDIHHLGYLPEIAELWLEKIRPRIESDYRHWRKMLQDFRDFAENGDFDEKKVHRYKSKSINHLPDWCRKPLIAYLEAREKESRAKNTLVMARSAGVRFCEFIVKNGLTCFSDISPSFLVQFNEKDYHKTVESKYAYNCRIRSFIRYLIDSGLITNLYLDKALPNNKISSRKIVETLTQEEEDKINNHKYNKDDTLSLRDEAMCKIGLHMGFRSVDIVKLNYKDIDWKAKEITITQQKTGTKLTLAMSPVVSNAIHRYIEYGRPYSKCPRIFVRHKAPFCELTAKTCRSALRRLLNLNEADSIKFHKTRKSFATNKLKRGAKIDEVANCLGHTSLDSLKHYLALEDEKMRKCPLTLTELGLVPEGGLKI